jgi:hypothetical protein
MRGRVTRGGPRSPSDFWDGVGKVEKVPGKERSYPPPHRRASGRSVWPLWQVDSRSRAQPGLPFSDKNFRLFSLGSPSSLSLWG